MAPQRSGEFVLERGAERAPGEPPQEAWSGDRAHAAPRFVERGKPRESESLCGLLGQVAGGHASEHRVERVKCRRGGKQHAPVFPASSPKRSSATLGRAAHSLLQRLLGERRRCGAGAGGRSERSRGTRLEQLLQARGGLPGLRCQAGAGKERRSTR
eukprot:1314779-Lingulodinium_polyedra.AAC.1